MSGEFDEAKDRLLKCCAPLFAAEARPRPDDGEVQAQAHGARPAAKPAPGLAIGHSVCPESGLPRLEVRLERKFDDRLDEVRSTVRKETPAGFAETNTTLTATPVVLLNHADATDADVDPILGAKCSPLHIGASLGHQNGYAGSLGCFVTIKDDETPHILSCSHILAMMGKARSGDHIYHPGRPDQDPLDADGRAAVLSKFFTVFSPDPMQEDAALAAVSCGEISGNVLPDIDCVPRGLRKKPLGEPLKVAELNARLPQHVRVAKIGRTTGWTEAALTSMSFKNLRTTFIDRIDNVEIQHLFTGVHETGWNAHGECFALPGDSGSLVFTLDDLRPIGLHFAAALDDTPTGYIIPWEKIENRFRCSFKMEV